MPSVLPSLVHRRGQTELEVHPHGRVATATLASAPHGLFWRTLVAQHSYPGIAVSRCGASMACLNLGHALVLHPAHVDRRRPHGPRRRVRRDGAPAVRRAWARPRGHARRRQHAHAPAPTGSEVTAALPAQSPWALLCPSTSTTNAVGTGPVRCSFESA
jgi:hypothetical protein